MLYVNWMLCYATTLTAVPLLDTQLQLSKPRLGSLSNIFTGNSWSLLQFKSSVTCIQLKCLNYEW